jgi:hypothetical protein
VLGSPHFAVTSDAVSPTDATPPLHWKDDRGSGGGKAEDLPTLMNNMDRKAAKKTNQTIVFFIVITFQPDVDIRIA